MNEFIALRARARQKRDKLIAAARAEYAATLVQIAALEQDLLGKVSSRYKKISACIESVIPKDRTFTTVDVMTALEALDPGRVWRKRSVDSHLSRLRERGLVRRLKRHSNTEPSVYVRTGVPVAPRPFEDQTLGQVIQVAPFRFSARAFPLQLMLTVHPPNPGLPLVGFNEAVLGILDTKQNQEIRLAALGLNLDPFRLHPGIWDKLRTNSTFNFRQRFGFGSAAGQRSVVFDPQN